MQVSETLLALQKLQTYNLIFSGPPVALLVLRWIVSVLSAQQIRRLTDFSAVYIVVTLHGRDLHHDIVKLSSQTASDDWIMTILGFHKSEGYSLFRGQLFYRKSSDKTSRSAVIPAFPIKFESLFIFWRAM